MQYKYAVALSVALGLFMAVLDNTIVNVSIFPMQESFDANLNDVQWVITAYFLAQAAIIPAAGYMSTWFGQKRMFMLFLGIFALGSLLCGLAETVNSRHGLDLLIAFRVLQGIGGGALFPVGTAIAFNVFPPEERASSSAFVGIPVLIAPTIGPTVGGLIVDSALGWPWIFFINVPIGILTLFILQRVLRPDEPRAAQAPHRAFDTTGLISSMIGVVLVAYAFTKVGETRPGSVSADAPTGEVYGWGYWLFWVLLGAGLVILASFTVYELRIARDPVMDLRLFRSHAFRTSTILTWATRATVFGSFFLLPLFLQQYRGLSAVEAGLASAPQGIGSALGVLSGARLYDMIGPRRLVVVGLGILALSTWWLTSVNPTTDGWDLAPILLLRGIGFGWGNMPLQTAALAPISGRALAKASSLYNATAQVFSSIGIAVISTYFLSHVVAEVNRIAGAAQRAGTAPPANLMAEAGARATSDVFLTLTFATVACALLAVLLPSKSLRQEKESGPEGRPRSVPAE